MLPTVCRVPPSHTQTRLSREVKAHAVASLLNRKLWNLYHLVLKSQRTRCRSLRSQMVFYTALMIRHPLWYCKLTEHWRGTTTDMYPRGEDRSPELWPWSIAADTLTRNRKSCMPPHPLPYPSTGHLASWCLSFLLCAMKGVCSVVHVVKSTDVEPDCPVQIMALPLGSCVTWSKLCKLFDPHFPHLKKIGVISNDITIVPNL